MSETEPRDRGRWVRVVQTTGVMAGTVLALSAFELLRVLNVASAYWWGKQTFGIATETFVHELTATLVAIPLCGFLWLLATGRFDRDAWRRADAWVLLPLGVALVLRLGVAPRSIQEIEIQLYDGLLPTMHSYIVPLLGRVVRQLPGDGHVNAFTLAGLLGALTVVPLQRWVTRRSDSVAVGLLAAMAYACHPIVVRFAPTDAPYGLMFFTFFASLACLTASRPSVIAGAVSLALAVSCRVDGLLLVPVAALLVGPTTLRSLWTSHRRALGIGALLATLICAGNLWTLIATQYADDDQVGRLVGLIPPIVPAQVLRDTLAHGPSAWDSDAEIVARRAWEALALLGGLAGLFDRRLRWASAALVGALILSAPYGAFSWTWPVALHRIVPSSTLLAVASGGGLAAMVTVARRPGRSLGVGLLVLSVATPVALAVASAPFLTRPWAFNVEWEMVRAALAPGGVDDQGCEVLAFGARDRDDLDIHDFGQMLYGVDMFGCWHHDCVAGAHRGTCARYIRGLRCYAAPDQVSAECAAPGLSAADSVKKCLIPECAAVESALHLRPMEERTLTPAITFEGAPMPVHFPTVATVGVYQVLDVAPDAAR